jgi:hypothetical protein
MSIYDDARVAINSIGNANLALKNVIAGHSDLAGLSAMLSDTSAMADLVAKAEAAAAPTPLVKGLIVENGSSPSPYVTNVTCNAYWRDLQLVQGGGLVPNNPIDKFLATGKSGRVRVFLGRYAPAWALALGKVHMYDPTDGNDADVPRWWEPKVQAAQQDFINKLAAAYDGKISAIFLATGSTIYAEPFIRGVADPRTRSNLLAAGYTADLDKASYEFSFQALGAFKKTRLAYAFNPWQFVTPGGNPGGDVTFTNAMIDRFRALYGQRAIIQNNSIRTPELGGAYPEMYSHMAGMKPLSFQTATEARIGDWAKTLQWAIDQGAHAVELSPQFQNHLTAAQLQQYDKALRAN